MPVLVGSWCRLVVVDGFADGGEEVGGLQLFETGQGGGGLCELFGGAGEGIEEEDLAASQIAESPPSPPRGTRRTSTSNCWAKSQSVSNTSSVSMPQVFLNVCPISLEWAYCLFCPIIIIHTK